MTNTIAVCCLVCVKGDSGTALQMAFSRAARESEEEKIKH